MTDSPAPYQTISRMAVAGLILLWFGHRFRPAFYPEVITGIMVAAVLIILGCVGLEVFQRRLQARRGNLYVIRNYTFWLSCFVVGLIVGTVAYTIYTLIAQSETANVIDSLFFIGVGAGATMGYYSYFYIDNVIIEHRVGPARTTLPLYAVDHVREDEEGFLLTSDKGEHITLNQRQFSKATWSDLRTRVRALDS